MEEHLRVRLVDGLPQRLERVSDGKFRSAFLFPKARRLEVLKFIESQPQHIVKRAKSLIEVLGYLPEGSRSSSTGHGMRGPQQNVHRDFISFLRNALQYIPSHPLLS